MTELAKKITIQSFSISLPNSSTVLVILLIIASYFLGSFTSKLQLKNGSGSNNQVVQAQAAAAQPNQVPSQIAPAQQYPSNPVKVSIAGDPILGDKNAELTLVEFSDYECPFCKKTFTELLPELKKDYIDTGKLRLVYKDLPLPFHQNAAKEAEAAQCAKDQGGDVAYFKYHDQIFTKTSGGGAGIALDQLPILAEEINLNVVQFQKCLDDGKFKAEVNKDLAEAQKVGANGTPTWFLGKTGSSDTIEGTIIVGAQPYTIFKTAIDKALAQ